VVNDRLAEIEGVEDATGPAQAFRRFGSEVTVFDVIPRLLGREDEEDAVRVVEE
jgi:pyruvate/2-oxoglutarate dehydrogenase complex dihydrolipoamide dehydrogenase (E3) component